MQPLTNYPKDLAKPISGESQETHISWSKDERKLGIAHIFTDDPLEYRRLLKKGYVPIAVTESSAKFEIEYRLVSIRSNKPKRERTEAEKQAAKENMAKMQAARQKEGS